MTAVIALGFQIHFFIESRLQVDSGLVGQAQHYKNHIG